MISHIENFLDARKILIKFIFLFFGSLIELDAVYIEVCNKYVDDYVINIFNLIKI